MSKRNQSGRLLAKQNKNENRVTDEQKELIDLLLNANVSKVELEKIIEDRKSGLEMDIHYFENQKQEEWLNGAFNQWKEEQELNYGIQLEQEHNDLLNKINQLRDETKKLEDSKNGIDEELKKLNQQKKTLEEQNSKNVLKSQNIVQDAEEKAKKIIDNANKNSEEIKSKIEEKVRRELDAQKSELDNREKQIIEEEGKLKTRREEFDNEVGETNFKLNIERAEIEKKQKLIDCEKSTVEMIRSMYSDYCPAKVKDLERDLEEKDKILNAKIEELLKVNKELHDVKMSQLMLSDVTEEDLKQQNICLRAEVDRLSKKYGSYTDDLLREMESAYNSRQEREDQISNLHNQLLATKNELARVNNLHLMTEQELAQLDLLRTLNSSLRKELDNTRRMIEGSSGDICVSLTDIDNEVANKYSSYNSELNDIKERTQQNNASLTQIIDHVYKYAATRPKPLYYSKEDLRAFLAGLSVSRLSILQGMSGTGKTSLPRVFMEAISGLINVVPVESSWRDRNELLGYYNDFSKRFSAKEFTCSLYRAGLRQYSEIPYFIVLDEMNLSRVEYYFADFLSVLEADPDDWKISLVDIDMRQLPTVLTDRVKAAINDDLRNQTQEQAQKIRNFLDRIQKSDSRSKTGQEGNDLSVAEKSKLVSYLASFEEKWKKNGNVETILQGPANLVDGKKIVIPKNVWFIGTANRDESTFEITDKVYDRAQVLNFNKRAAKHMVTQNQEPIRITVQHLDDLFENARQRYQLSSEGQSILQEVENELHKHGVAYGNRIADQIEKFVPVYVMAGPSSESKDKLEKEAIDYQLTNKVLRKLDVNDLSKDSIESLKDILIDRDLGMALAYIENQETK